MALNLYYYDTTTDQYLPFTAEDPFHSIINGADGDKQTRKIFLRNDSSSYYYTGITITPVPSELVIEGNDKGISFKLFAGNRQPSTEDWDAIESGDSISMTPIGSDGTIDNAYYPLWTYVELPPKSQIFVELGISLQVDFTENSMGD